MEPKEFNYSETLEALYGLSADCADALMRKNNFSIKDLKLLAEKAGFSFPRTSGSHMIGKHPTHRTLVPLKDIINLQTDSGKAKPYQVKQVVEFIQLAQPK